MLDRARAMRAFLRFQTTRKFTIKIAVPVLAGRARSSRCSPASSVCAWIYLRAIAAAGDPHLLCDVVIESDLLLLSVLVLLATL